MKKIILLLIMCLPMMAWADQSGTCGENLTWTYVESTNTLTISGTGAMYQYTQSDRYPWKSLRSSIKTIVINNGVTSIERDAFYNCSSLTSIDMPNSVTSIGSYAFYDCSSLTSATIPEGVTSIEKKYFLWPIKADQQRHAFRSFQWKL